MISPSERRIFMKFFSVISLIKRFLGVTPPRKHVRERVFNLVDFIYILICFWTCLHFEHSFVFYTFFLLCSCNSTFFDKNNKNNPILLQKFTIQDEKAGTEGKFFNNVRLNFHAKIVTWFNFFQNVV